jgi:hypothetical protein
MKKISSPTFFSRRVFPVIWFGFLAFLVVAMAFNPKNFNFLSLAVPLLMAGFGFVLMKNLLWSLVDEVYDCGDSLLIRNRGEEESVALSNIMNVSVSMNMNPARITLRLANPGKFGREIAFSPIRTFSFNPFAKDPISDDLILRVDQARSKRTG